MVGTKVLEGALRRFAAFGRRMGDVDPPRGGTVTPVLGFACGDKSGPLWPGSGVDSMDPSALPCSMLLDDLLSGIGVGPILALAANLELFSVSSRYEIVKSRSEYRAW